MSSGGEHPVYEVAVVGSAGFLGGAICEVFAAAGVTARGFTLDDPLVNGGLLNPEALSVRTVVWCASRINPRLAVEQPALIDADKRDIDQALHLFADAGMSPRLVSFSSGGTLYGPPSTPPFAEGDAVHPVNAYGEAKYEIENHLAQSGLDTVTLRVANAYGPGQRPAPGQGVLAHWMEAVLGGSEVHLYGDPDATRDYVYVDDIARAALAAHRADSAPPIVNIGSGVPTTLDELLEVLRPVVAPHALRVVRHEARATDAAHSTLDVSLAADALGWRPLMSLAEGVERMWAWRAGS
ncbi:NAD-dependent epimerase/dehydratase family protein [Demequina sp. TTPB684]|uniref:NAD-dependent epimerase/dehydratase family protein n=1 Tax=unclassified Demequina TaxID=2620311 RepID=UPI001CF28BC8|nr:NAD-dependent epimerase/dehydratase family protein [Demequina sp. TMPB413]MCB2412728.1 NAD-dependent epimerase/dehydratase family protein [Demequina sp. TTPB684]UPU87850.1 NAD-dependent epimerase/dehydratase family protein [Demequina sp. TMPB413]